MTPVAWLVAVIAIAVMVLAAGYVVMTTLNRRRLLKERFGSEHDRTVRGRDGRKKAGQELQARELRHSRLGIRPLSREVHTAYARKSSEVQERSVDASARSDGQRAVSSMREADRR
ncbi:hypothetical protein [Microtetraspora malaysiensis]|uniref:hypothetical protein n=1 Tax=Microtetraspora malaysiensis TaxID=161358 RepID=UPI003D92CFA0